MGNICPEEELDDHTWEFLLRACEEDEDNDNGNDEEEDLGEEEDEQEDKYEAWEKFQEILHQKKDEVIEASTGS